MAAWISAIGACAASPVHRLDRRLYLGGDHSISAGSVRAEAGRAATLGRPLHVLWIDAHPDFHTLDTTATGNLHGTPLAYVAGVPGFGGRLPAIPDPVDPARIRILAGRDVDEAEDHALLAHNVIIYGMDHIAAHGAARLVAAFAERVAASNGLLHVSFDVDSLDPSIAPATGTPVPGGLRRDEAFAVMATLRDCGLVSSADIVEYNPSLDRDGTTAKLVVDLAAVLCGEDILCGEDTAHRHRAEDSAKRAKTLQSAEEPG